MNAETKDFLLHEYDAGRQVLIALEGRRYTSFRFLLILAAAFLAAGGAILKKAPEHLWLLGISLLLASFLCRLICKALQNEEKAISRYRNQLNWIRGYFLSGDDSVEEYINNPEKYGSRTGDYVSRSAMGPWSYLPSILGGSKHTFSTSHVILIGAHVITLAFLLGGIATIAAVVLCCKTG